jgi:hypothetical protein
MFWTTRKVHLGLDSNRIDRDSESSVTNNVENLLSADSIVDDWIDKRDTTSVCSVHPLELAFRSLFTFGYTRKLDNEHRRK